MRPSRVLLTVFFLSAMLTASGTGVSERLRLPTALDSPRQAEAASGVLDPAPLNSTFDSGDYLVGTPPTNNGFQTGDLTGWTVNGTVVVLSGGPDGYYARLNNNATLTSSAFDVPSDAQTLTYRVGFYGTQVGIDASILYGSGYSTEKHLTPSDTGSSGWITRTINVTQWAGQSIKLKFKGLGSYGAVDTAGMMYVVLAHWDVSDTHKNFPELKSDGPDGNYARVKNGTAPISSAFTVPEGAGTLIYQRRVQAPENTGIYNLWVRCAPDYQRCPSWPPLVLNDKASPGQWLTKEVDISDYQGQTIKLEFENAGTFDLDGLGMRVSHAALAGDPTDTASGAFTHSHTDLLIPGTGLPLEFTRYYNSQASVTSSLGYRWMHTYAWKLTFPSASRVTVNYPNGDRVTFTQSGGSYTPPAGTYDTLVKNGDNTYSVTTKAQARYNLSSAGKLTSIVDRNDNALTVNYDGNGFLASVTDQTDRSLTFTTDGSGRVTQIADPLDRTVGFEYDASGDLVDVTDVKGGTTTYTYSNHRMTSLTDANAHLANQNIYDTANRVVEQTDAMDGKTCFYYGSAPVHTSAACPGVSPAPQAGQTAVVDPRGNKTTYDFDSTFHTTAITDALDGIISYTYDSNNNPTCVTDQLGHKAAYAYDSKGNVTQVIDALNTDANCDLAQGGVDWEFTYTANNDVDLATDPLDRQTDYVYDGDGNLTQVIHKDDGGATKSRACFTRDDAGLVTELVQSTTLTDCTGHTTLFEYDDYGNQTAVVDPRFSGQQDPPETALTYDLGGRLLTTTNELAHTTTYTYDAQNNVLTVTDNLDDVTTYTYDAKGNLETVTDANRQTVGDAEAGADCGSAGTGNDVDDDSDTVKDDGCPSVIYDYDDADRLVEVIDALGQSTTYEYDANGNRTSVTNARDKTTTYAYEELNRLESVTDPLSRVTSYQYDAAGNLSERTDGNEQTTTYTYDDANRLTDIDYPEGTADVSFTYDAVGNRETMGDGTGTTSYDYDDLNRLTSVTFPGSRTVGYDYDNVGDRTSITYPGGVNEVTYTYDEAHNLSTVTGWNDAATTYTYDDAGQLAEAALPNDVVSTYSYDDAHRLTGITHVKDQDTLASVEYTPDAVGNRTERVDQLGTHSYTYDDLYRLTEVTYPGPSTTSYTYDAVGNRETLEDGSGTTTYDYDDADQLTSVTPPGQQAVEYSWDDNGNLSERGADTYDWNAGDKMTSATVGGVTTSMAYNGDGLRDSRTVGEDSVTFTWDVAQSIPQVIDDGSLAYIYGLGRVSQVAADGTTFYYLSDGLGSEMALTDADGEVVNTYDYDVFGSVSSQTGSQPNEFQFTGEQVDSTTALQYLRARYYDPAIGRFLSRDPIGGFAMTPQSLNRYAYVMNNPVNWLDPWGLRNVEGTPTPTPPAWMWVCGPARQAECLNRHWVNPALGFAAAWAQAANAWADVLGSVRSALTSECSQGLARTVIGTLAAAGAVTGAGALIEAGGLVAVSAATAATSAAAVGAAAGPENMQGAVTFLPAGLVQVYENCGF